MIELHKLRVQAGQFALTDISCTIPTGSYGVLMGRTGSGKTTILESILGLRQISSGVIRIHGSDVTHLNPALRGIGYVPQDGALFSKMTVKDHLAIALLIRKAPAKVIADRVEELATLLGITSLLNRFPQGLSGGEAQRVALGRALSFRPQVLCLDEPLSALDSQTRQQMCEILVKLKTQSTVTTLHVTHHLDEATQLADCLFQLEGGKMIPFGSGAAVSPLPR